jgi:hypothetical protein
MSKIASYKKSTLDDHALVVTTTGERAVNVTGNVSLVDANGIQVDLGDATTNGLRIPSGDYVSRADTDAVTEVWTYKVGGASGTITGTVTVVYTNTTRTTFSSITSQIL